MNKKPQDERSLVPPESVHKATDNACRAMQGYLEWECGLDN
jgi:hypothetical protein